MSWRCVSVGPVGCYVRAGASVVRWPRGDGPPNREVGDCKLLIQTIPLRTGTVRQSHIVACDAPRRCWWRRSWRIVDVCRLRDARAREDHVSIRGPPVVPRASTEVGIRRLQTWRLVALHFTGGRDPGWSSHCVRALPCIVVFASRLAARGQNAHNEHNRHSRTLHERTSGRALRLNPRSECHWITTRSPEMRLPVELTRPSASTHRPMPSDPRLSAPSFATCAWSGLWPASSAYAQIAGPCCRCRRCICSPTRRTRPHPPAHRCRVAR